MATIQISNKDFVANAILAEQTNKCIPYYRTDKDTSIVIVVPNNMRVQSYPDGYQVKKVKYKYLKEHRSCIILEKYYSSELQLEQELQLWDTHTEYTFGSIKKYRDAFVKVKGEIGKYLSASRKPINNNFRITKLK